MNLYILCKTEYIPHSCSLLFTGTCLVPILVFLSCLMDVLLFEVIPYIYFSGAIILQAVCETPELSI